MPSNKGSNWKSKGAYGVKDLFKHYKSLRNVDNKVSESVFRSVIRECNKEFMSILIFKGLTLRVPHLGKMVVAKRHFFDQNKSAFDYDHYNKTGEKTMHLNEHSDGFRGRLHWHKLKIYLPGYAKYGFKACRNVTRTISSEMKKPGGHIKYSELKFHK